MDLKSKIRMALGITVKMAFQGKLSDGTIVTSEADELSSGSSIMILTEDGTQIPLPPGEYQVTDGPGFSVEEEGIIAEIYSETEETEETEVEAEETPDVDAVKEEVKKEVATEVVDAIVSDVDVIAEVIDEVTPEEVTPELAKEIAAVVVEVVSEKISEVTEGTPAEETPAEEELRMVKKELSKYKRTIKAKSKKFSKMKSRYTSLSKKAATGPINLNKFSSKNLDPVPTEAEWRKMSKKDRLSFNLRNIRK